MSSNLSDPKTNEEVSKQISQLSKDTPDLSHWLRNIVVIIIESKIIIITVRGTTMNQKAGEKGKESTSVREREKRAEREIIPVKATSSRSKKTKTEIAHSTAASASAVASSSRMHAPIPTAAALPHPAAQLTIDPSHFFDHVKRALDSRKTYNEFLKVVNLFTQGYINTARLVKESRNFLVGDGELMRGWKEILGWDGRREEAEGLGQADGWTRPVVVDGVVERPVSMMPGKVDLSARYGSYRKLPESEINVTCSGRDSMCCDVLNDEWVSHPTWTLNSSSYISVSSSSSGGNVAYPDPFDNPTLFWSVSRKNVYEEALHRSEEERHEYDFHIEAISRTITILEPINNKIQQLAPEEHGSFRLKPNLGGNAKAILSGSYGKSTCESPTHAIPVVLSWLKQKEEEWKRAQREWNKFWREVDARNYAKSLDHQSVNLKAVDKKVLTTKAFVNEIKAAREEQMASRASLINPLFARTRPRHQLEIAFDDLGVLQDSLKLVFSFLDRTQGQITWNEQRRIEAFLRGWIPLVFMIDAGAFNAAFAVVQELSGAEGELDVEGLGLLDVEAPVTLSSRSGGGSRSKKGGSTGSGVSGGDLRRKLLKSEQAKSGRKTRAGVIQSSPSVSRFASPTPTSGEQISKIVPKTARKQATFFTNTTLYVLLRLVGVLYSRLTLFKTIATQLSQESPQSQSESPSSSHDAPAQQFTSFGPSSSKISNIRTREESVTSVKDVNMDSTTFSAPFNTQQAAEESEEVRTTKESEHERKAAAVHIYIYILLQSCERLFDNEIEQIVFEDQMRFMFGIKDAFKIFTIDKLIGVIIKQLTETKSLTVQLIGKDDSSYNDSEVLTGRWQAYIDSYVSNESMEGVAQQKVKKPFLTSSVQPHVL
ncbi:hypothetical protein BT96DRAFT_1049212 [Gymnopus androsaceus JB14]|uniref:Histone deacetylase interacting domain-containing protein n=1 Tax=Gymnopus androsaceus JB14 TaxID=1447944 RepID=A0A6A4H8L5_9AGAR|nr:hypothetical protein BT96DRAFT_1049212 [Gymnopus androsaceus JB14]